MYGEEIKTLRNRPRSCLDFDFCCAKSNGFDFMVMVMGTKSNLAYVPVFRRYFFLSFWSADELPKGNGKFAFVKWRSFTPTTSDL